ncbi:MAG: hypothetical protein H6831_16015 [Planctomycetes bacterium]|nr:hypothetical protein [Planctomycetota bacterium]MCB9905906.1 hypothetical protein [Planctomycetota bacterium]
MTRPLLRPLFLLLVLAACSVEESTALPVPAAEAVSTEQVAAHESEPGPSAAALADPSHAILFEQHEITDPARGDMPAYRLLVPHGWKLEGGITPVAPAFSMIPTFSQVTVEAPDGRGAMFWSMLEFGCADGYDYPIYTPFEGRPFFPLQASLGDYWMLLFERAPAKGVTKMEVVSERELSAATKHVRKQYAAMYESTRQENAQLAGIGESMEFDAHARELVLRYTKDERRIEATVFAVWRRAIYRYPDGSIRRAMWNLDNMYAVFGPVGTNPRQDPVLAAIVRARRELPEWQVAIQRWYLERNQQIVAEGLANLAATARAQATTHATQSQDVLDISFQGWKSRNAAGDAGQASAVNGIHERTTYAEPGGTTIDLPSHYNNVYTDGLGGYVLHNDANYEINTDPAFNGREWQRIEPQR